MNVKPLAALLILAAIPQAHAHSGRTDAYGCHNETATGLYHCHSGLFAGRTFPSKEAMLAELGSQGPSTPPSTSLIYNRDDYLPDWADEDHDCINTRHEVLIQESLVPVTMSASGCSVVFGLWHDPHTNLDFTNASDVDIDHFVPLKEAHESGAAYWSTAQKQAYANDLRNPLVLIAVDDGTNSAKSDKDPAEWLPPNAAYHCDYVKNWVAIKDFYNLSIDLAEQAAIDAVLSPGADALPTAVASWRFTNAPQGAFHDVRFTIGMELNDECGFYSTAHVSDQIKITGTIYPLESHLGRYVDLYLVDRVNLDFRMRTESGAFVPWNSRVPDLVPVQRGVLLSDAMTMTVFEGKVGVPGEHRLFLGYKFDGVLYYMPEPVRLEIVQ